MDRDWGSRDAAFIELTARVRRRLLALANAGDAFGCVPMQGSGTFAVEAQLGTLVPRDGHLLILVGGAYGWRMAEICRRAGRVHSALETAEDEPPTAAAVAERLAAAPDVTDVALVHCETTTGILNPLAEIAAAVRDAGRRLHVDAMSSFGGIPIDLARLPLASLAASANKCLEGVPGVGFVIVRTDHLATCAGNAHAVSLDLHGQWKGLEEANGQWRFTPPTQILAALDRALDALDDEGGVAGRFARYWETCRTLVDGLRGLGFETLLEDAVQAPIIVTFRAPADAAWDFRTFYDRLAARGFVIYPGKLAQVESFRVGCIGAFRADTMARFVDAADAVLREMGVDSGTPGSLPQDRTSV
jgi:2-aminoethylphosphonate-pyruvate transaminase